MTSIAESRGAFVDTSAWLALMNRHDPQYRDAVRFHHDLGSSVPRISTWGVLAETYTWLRYHAGYRHAERWLHEAGTLQERGVLVVVYPSAMMEASILRILSRFSDHDLSYVDAFSLHIIQLRVDIDVVFAFDHHLTLAGKPVLPGSLSQSPRYWGRH